MEHYGCESSCIIWSFTPTVIVLLNLNIFKTSYAFWEVDTLSISKWGWVTRCQAEIGPCLLPWLSVSSVQDGRSGLLTWTQLHRWRLKWELGSKEINIMEKNQEGFPKQTKYFRKYLEDGKLMEEWLPRKHNGRPIRPEDKWSCGAFLSSKQWTHGTLYSPLILFLLCFLQVNNDSCSVSS